jgi:parallel beta-helix repeat protein
MQSISPKNGNSFTGETGAILNGSRLLTPQAEGAYWVVYGQTQQGIAVGTCTSSNPRCMYPEDLFLDGRTLVHAASLSGVGPGTWFFDYAADKIYMGDNPSGHTVETSVTNVAFSGGAANVTIRGLIVEKYASPAQRGAIGGQASGNGWLVDHCEVRLNHGVGVRVSTQWHVTNSNIHHNGELGMGGVGNDILVQSNEIAFNNALNFLTMWEGGSTKFSATQRLQLRNNYSHDNLGLGLWTDSDNIDTVMDGNTVTNNRDGGISHEIGYAATISNNIVKNNGPSQCSWIWGGQIQVQNSQNVEVFGNTVVVSASGCGQGITIIQQNRGNGAYGPYVSINNHIHNNSITHLGAGGGSGAAMDFIVPDIWNSGNTFDYNNYHVASTSQYHWIWSNSLRNWADIRSFGVEAHGTVDNNLIP